MVFALLNLKSQIFSFLETILTVLDPDPDPDPDRYEVSDPGGSGFGSERADPDLDLGESGCRSASQLIFHK